MKIMAVSMVLLFFVSGYLVMAHGSGSEKSISSGDKSGNISIKNLPIASVDNSSNDTVIANISVGSYPRGIAYDSSNGCVYVTNFNSSSVSVINGATNTVIANISVGSNPLGIAYDSSNGCVYVTNFNSSSVSVINGATNTVIANIAVGSNSLGIAYDSSNGYVYVTYSISNGVVSNCVSVINGATNKVIGRIAVGSNPGGVAYDPSNGYVYVANSNSSTVNVISTSPKVIKIYKVTFTELGLPSGASWSVTLTGRTFNGQYINVTLSSTTNTITFNEPNGTYSYTIHLPSGYQSNSVKGQVNVSGNSAIATIKAQQIIKPQQTTNYLSIGIIAVVIVIAIVIGAISLRRGKNKKSVK